MFQALRPALTLATPYAMRAGGYAAAAGGYMAASTLMYITGRFVTKTTDRVFTAAVDRTHDALKATRDEIRAAKLELRAEREEKKRQRKQDRIDALVSTDTYIKTKIDQEIKRRIDAGTLTMPNRAAQPQPTYDAEVLPA